MAACSMTTRGLAGLIWGACVALAAGTLVLLALGAGHHTAVDGSDFAGWSALSFVAASLAFATVGAMVAARAPENSIGWIFCLAGVALGASDFASQYANQMLFISSPPAARRYDRSLASEPRPGAVLWATRPCSAAVPRRSAPLPQMASGSLARARRNRAQRHRQRATSGVPRGAVHRRLESRRHSGFERPDGRRFRTRLYVHVGVCRTGRSGHSGAAAAFPWSRA